MDSWDLAQGVMDDAGGVMVCYQAIRSIIGLGLRPRRTIRLVGWTGEEMGVFGGRAYAQAHQAEVNNIILAFESDLGTFKPLGLEFPGKPNGFAAVKEIASTLLVPLNTTTVLPQGGGADIGDLMRMGVPGMSPLTANERYFWYHHSAGDSMTVQNPEEMDQCSAMISSFMFIVADMTARFPRD